MSHDQPESLGVVEAFSGPISPELALVCPELGRLARRQLPEPGEVYCGTYPRQATAAPHTEHAVALRRLPDDLHDAIRLKPAIAPVRDEERAPPPSPPEQSSVPVQQAAASGTDEVSADAPRRVALRSVLIVAGSIAALIGVPELGTLFRENRPTLAPAVTSEPPARPSAPATENGIPQQPSLTVGDSGAEKAGRPGETSPPASTPNPAPLALNLHWPPNAKATYYNVQVYRGTTKVFEAWPAAARVKLPRNWTYRGSRYRLTPGLYKWFAWPGFGTRSADRYGQLPKRGTFYVAQPTG